jgi:hypothetical protein
MKLAEIFKKEFEKIGVELIPAGKKVYVISGKYNISEEINITAAFAGLMTGLFKDPKEKAIAEAVDGFDFFCENELTTEDVTNEVLEMIKAQVENFKNVFERS